VKVNDVPSSGMECVYIHGDNMKEKVTIVGEPISVKEFGQLLKDMYEKDENGVPLWKKVFGVDEKDD
jgi:hypothetical protein